MGIVASTGQVSDIQMDYMKLLVTELRNQNPLEPLDNREMASQLAQFSQLQQLEAMNSRFAAVLTTVEHAYANSLIGKEVSFLSTTEKGSVELKRGTVGHVSSDSEGGVLLEVADNLVALDQIVSVRNI